MGYRTNNMMFMIIEYSVVITLARSDYALTQAERYILYMLLLLQKQLWSLFSRA